MYGYLYVSLIHFYRGVQLKTFIAAKLKKRMDSKNEFIVIDAVTLENIVRLAKEIEKASAPLPSTDKLQI